MKVNVRYNIIIISLIKCLIDKKSVEKENSKNDNYYPYFKALERCLKEIQKLNKSLRLDVKELSILNEFIAIYNVFEKDGKLNNLDIIELIGNLTKSLEVIEKNEKNKIRRRNLKNLNIVIKKNLYDSSKKVKLKEVKSIMN